MSVRACEPFGNKQRPVALAAKAYLRGARLAACTVPLAPVGWDGLDMAEPGEDSRRRFRPSQAGPDSRRPASPTSAKVIGDRRRRNPELLDHAGLIQRDAGPAIPAERWREPPTHWARSLSGVQTIHAFDARIARPAAVAAAASGIVGPSELNHWPDDYASRRKVYLPSNGNCASRSASMPSPVL